MEINKYFKPIPWTLLLAGLGLAMTVMSRSDQRPKGWIKDGSLTGTATFFIDADADADARLDSQPPFHWLPFCYWQRAEGTRTITTKWEEFRQRKSESLNRKAKTQKPGQPNQDKEPEVKKNIFQ